MFGDLDIKEKLFTADSSKIDKIEIARTDVSITLEKVNGQWMVTKPVNYQADTNAVCPILGNLQDFKIESITSEKPDNFHNYLDSALHPVVTAYQGGNKLGTFEVGKYAISYSNAYLKLPDENRILLASNLTSNNFTKPLKDFRYKVITSIPTPGLTKIVFKSTDSNKVDFTAIKDTAGRWFIGNDSIPKNNMDGFTNTLSNFMTEDFKDTVPAAFPEPTYTLTVFAPQQITINLYKDTSSTPASFIVQVSNIKQLFKFSSAFAANIMKKKTDFIPAPKKEEPKKDDKKKK